MSAAAAKPVFEESFGRRLRRERERRQIAIASIADNTKISGALFEDLERDDASRWPSGIFRRSFIKAYAQAIGLDTDATVHEFLERFPDPNDPDGMIAPEIAAPAPAAAPPPAASVAPGAGLRLTLATDTPFTRKRLLASLRDRVAAIACDAAVVATVGLAMYAVMGSFWMPLCVALVGYYAGGVLLLGNTPGVCLCAPGDRKHGSSLAAARKAIAAWAPRRRPSALASRLPGLAAGTALLVRARQILERPRPSRLRDAVSHRSARPVSRARTKPELVESPHEAFEAAQLIGTRRSTENA